MLKKSLLILFGSGTCLLSYWTLRIYFNRRKFRHIPGPPTKGIYGFYFGNMAEVIQNVEQGGSYFELLLKWYVINNLRRLRITQINLDFCLFQHSYS